MNTGPPCGNMTLPSVVPVPSANYKASASWIYPNLIIISESLTNRSIRKYRGSVVIKFGENRGNVAIQFENIAILLR